jgi:hypothetical protein
VIVGACNGRAELRPRCCRSFTKFNVDEQLGGDPPDLKVKTGRTPGIAENVAPLGGGIERRRVKVKVPATSANMGPGNPNAYSCTCPPVRPCALPILVLRSVQRALPSGFDTIGVALDVWRM